jgi:hypothetical protein
LDKETTMTAERPTSVRIGWRDYEIKYVPSSQEMDPNNRGLIRHGESVIIIADDQTPLATAETILHEIMHGVFAHSGLRQSPRLEEEFVCSTLSDGLMSVFANNKDLVRWLDEVLHG